MRRFEFLEFLLRLVRTKYLEKMGYSQYPQALQHLFANHIITFLGSPHFKPWQQWQGFREKELWTLDVNDCLHANQENLRKVYNLFCGRPRPFMNRGEALRFMQWGTETGKQETKKKSTSPAVHEVAVQEVEASRAPDPDDSE